MKMLIDGRYYTEQEISQYFHDYAAQCNRLADKVDELKETIKHLDSKNYNLTEKLEEIGTAFNEQVSLVGWHEEREKEYKRLLKSAVGTLNDTSCTKDCRKCAHNSDGCDYSCRFKWNHTDEVIKLIGGDDECI